jgi:hypothetical protein
VVTEISERVSGLYNHPEGVAAAFIELIRHFPVYIVYRCGKTGITAFVIDSAAEYTEQNRASGLGRNAAERNRP